LKIKLDDKLTIIIILVLIAIFSLSFLGFTGFKTIFGMLIVFFIPFYYILDSFKLQKSEKVIFAFFLGLGIFPAIAYWLGRIMSFRIAIILTFLLLILAGYVLNKKKSK